METLPVPVLAELLAMLPYRDLIKFESLSRQLRAKLSENASLVAAFMHMRCEVPEHVRVTKASFVQLKAVLRTLDATRPESIYLRPVTKSVAMNVNGTQRGSGPTFAASLGSSQNGATHVVTSLSMFKAASEVPFTAVLFVSYDAVNLENVDEAVTLFAQTQTCEAVSEMERAGLLSISAWYDYEQEWKAAFLRAPYCDKLRPVLWVQMAADFKETVTLVFTRPLLARFVYVFSADTHHFTCVHLSMRGAEMTLLAS